MHPKRLEEKLDSSISPREPIAIVGMGCRFPGAHNLVEFWQVLEEGRDTLSDYPGGRGSLLDSAFFGPGVRSKRGGFLPNLDQLDARFFGISPREAEFVDPQQRLLLEVAWEAIEDAGIVREKLVGSRTGVFVGLWTSDYENCLREGKPSLQFHSTIGTGRYAAAGRLSYFFDLRGPCFTLDAACSSSLVAVHLACQSLWSGESELALAGGANAILRPEISLAYSSVGMLSPEGQCKFGDANGNGYVRSEGAGVIVLKPLSRALADNDSIYALVRGGAVNNDGSSSGSLVAPSPIAQADLLRQAFAHAGVAASDIGYIEAHGTGTAVGDPVEIEAVSNVLREAGTQAATCFMGSVKTNIGHTEAAAGVAGVIKAALALHHGIIPASRNCAVLNPKIDWENSPVSILRSNLDWQGNNRFAGVTSFGITGTNAHVVLENAPQNREPTQAPASSHDVFLLSGHLLAALQEKAASWRQHLASAPNHNIGNLCYVAAARSTHHAHRLAVVAKDTNSLHSKLEAWTKGDLLPGVISGQKREVEQWKPVFVIAGAGGQWHGMGLSLLRDEPVFRLAMERCNHAVMEAGGPNLLEELKATQEASHMGDMNVLQPLLWAMFISFAELWRSKGIEPSAVIAHSMGELAAAVICGALTIEEGASIIVLRGRLMMKVSGQGGMAATGLTAEEAERILRPYGTRLGIAAINGATSTVVSGDSTAIDELLLELEKKEVFCRRVKANLAAHSSHMDAIRNEFESLIPDLAPKATRIPFYSTTTGNIEAGSILDANYWGRNLRETVRFWPTLKQVLADGYNAFIELSPHPVLLHSVEEAIREAGVEAVAVASSQRNSEELSEILSGLATLHVAGLNIDFSRLYPHGKSACLLPTYPWQRERYWLQEANPKESLLSTDQPIESSLQPGTWLWPPRTAKQESLGTILAMLWPARSGVLPSDPILKLSGLEWTSSISENDRVQLALLDVGQKTCRLQLARQTPSGWVVCSRGSIMVSTQAVEQLVAAAPPATITLSQFSWETLFYEIEQSIGRTFGYAVRTTSVDELVVLQTKISSASEVLLSLECKRDLISGDVEVKNKAGNLVACFRGMKFEPREAEKASKSLYELDWERIELSGVRASAKAVAIVDFDGASTGALVGLLKQAGFECHIVRNAEGLRTLQTSVSEVIHLVPTLSSERSEAVDLEIVPKSWVLHCLDACREIQASSRTSAARLSFVTVSAFSEANSLPRLDHTSMHGFASAIRREYPELHCRQIDLSSVPFLEEEARGFVQLLASNLLEDTVLIRGSKLIAPRFKPTSLSDSSTVVLSPDATYLLTGGLGGVGLEMARWMSENGARHLVLIGRKAPSSEAEASIVRIRSAGAQVYVRNLDITDAGEVSSLISEIKGTLPELRGIIHAAAVLSDALLHDVVDSQVDQVFQPKVVGAWNLHQATTDLELDFFVLCSSIAVSMTQPGQGIYAAANSWLDAFAFYRKSVGKNAVSVQWSVWADTGLAKAEGTRRSTADYIARGVRPLSASLGVAALGLALQSSSACVLAAPVSWPKFSASYAPDPCPSLFASLAKSTTTTAEAAKGEQIGESLSDSLATLNPNARKQALEDHLREQLAAILKTTIARIEPRKPLGAQGLDSLLSLELVRRLSRTTGVKLSATVVFNHSTVVALAAEIGRRMGIKEQPTLATDNSNAAPETSSPVSSDIQQLSEEEAILALMANGEV
jgi:acyl transferase domain-containing protein/NAD(P)-dependent dehydrogenase (short-subunit alcohol dehydrogenase family)/acyl carrier protein